MCFQMSPARLKLNHFVRSYRKSRIPYLSRRTVVLLAKLGKQGKRPTVGTTGTVYYSLNNSYSCKRIDFLTCRMIRIKKVIQPFCRNFRGLQNELKRKIVRSKLSEI